jgi:hypothetical protein
MSIGIVSTGPVLYSSLGFIARIECVRLLTLDASKTLHLKLYALIATADGWIQLSVSGAFRLTSSSCHRGGEIRDRAWNPLPARTQLAEIEVAIEDPADQIFSSLKKR